MSVPPRPLSFSLPFPSFQTLLHSCHASDFNSTPNSLYWKEYDVIVTGPPAAIWGMSDQLNARVSARLALPRPGCLGRLHTLRQLYYRNHVYVLNYFLLLLLSGYLSSMSETIYTILAPAPAYYECLPDNNTFIRLLTVRPIASDGTVTCCVTVHRLTSEAIVPDSFHAPPWKNYAALSYTWGAPDAPKKLINMNGRPVKNGRIGRTSYTRDLFTAARTSTTGWTPYASTKRTSLRRMRRSHL